LVSARPTSRTANLISRRPTNHKISAPATFHPRATNVVIALATIAFMSIASSALSYCVFAFYQVLTGPSRIQSWPRHVVIDAARPTDLLAIFGEYTLCDGRRDPQPEPCR